ncbi:MAG: 50S ribosomal protein L4 [Candidatus Levybacteria bacterium]|nr:50S ribosomal protein L4 [Candidatus Levybacteria bacterium]
MPVSKLTTNNSQLTTQKTKKATSEKRQAKSSKGGLSVQVFTAAGRAAGTMQLPKEIFGAEVNKNLISQAVRVYLANQRMGTASTKSRGEINASTRKIWRQKGTGRARHGAKSAPIFVHGGVAHGPKPRDYSLKLPKKMKKVALVSALSAKLKDGHIKILTGLEKVEPKTKNVAAMLKKLGHSDKTLLVTPNAAGKGFENIFRAGRNIEGINILPVNTLNTYEVLDSRMILFMKQSIDTLKESLTKEQK